MPKLEYTTEALAERHGYDYKHLELKTVKIEPGETIKEDEEDEIWEKVGIDENEETSMDKQLQKHTYLYRDML